MTSASELRDAFAKFDANGDGYLSVEELVGVFTRPVGDGQPMTEADARAFIEKNDKNGDGKLDLDEFAAAMVAEQAEEWRIRQEQVDKGKWNLFGRTSWRGPRARSPWADALADTCTVA
jgi:hypothetical protein